VSNSADWDDEFHYYYDGQRMIETRDGCDYVRKQYVWGVGYVDELVQIATNFGDNNLCDRFYYACQDANYNVLGVTDAAGVLVERYEYTPYPTAKGPSTGTPSTPRTSTTTGMWIRTTRPSCWPTSARATNSPKATPTWTAMSTWTTSSS